MRGSVRVCASCKWSVCFAPSQRVVPLVPFLSRSAGTTRANQPQACPRHYPHANLREWCGAPPAHIVPPVSAPHHTSQVRAHALTRVPILPPSRPRRSTRKPHTSVFPCSRPHSRPRSPVRASPPLPAPPRGRAAGPRPAVPARPPLPAPNGPSETAPLRLIQNRKSRAPAYFGD